jgi:CRP-like cAMP-binding protein
LALERPKNLILQALPAEDYTRLAPQLATTDLPFKRYLHRDGETINTVFFPWSGVCSITRVMSDGRMVEVATIGREGAVGYMVGLGDDTATGDCMVQVEGGGSHTLSAAAFRSEVDRRGALYRLITRYTNAVNVLAFQSVACNALHTAEERCARWLLLVHDRVAADTFPLSHEFLSVMLGVRRPTATIAAGILQRAGLITYKRGRMTILNREKLEEASCECYEAVEQHFRRLLPIPLIAEL